MDSLQSFLLSQTGVATSLRFGEFVLDTEARQLLRAGRPVTLTPKAFQLLELLVTRRPRGVSKADIHDQLWPRTFVSEGNIARLMFEVRQALGEDAGEPRYLRTLRGFGYAFAGLSAAADEVSAPGVHRLVWGERTVTLQPGDNVLGRGTDAMFWIDAPSVSRRHAVIRVEGDAALVTDLGSKNGTSVGDQDCGTSQTLTDGDVIRLGSVRLVYKRVSAEANTQTLTKAR